MTRKAVMGEHRVGWPFCGSSGWSRRDRHDNRLSGRLTDNGLGKFIPGTVAAVRDMTDPLKIAHGQLMERVSQIVGIGRAASLVGDNLQHWPLLCQPYDR